MKVVVVDLFQYAVTGTGIRPGLVFCVTATGIDTTLADTKAMLIIRQSLCKILVPVLSEN